MTGKAPEPPQESRSSTPGSPAAVPMASAARPAAPRPRPRRDSSGAGAAVIAVVALLLALGAAGVAVYALDVARDAKSRAAEAASVVGRQTTTAARPSAPAPSPASPTASAGPRYLPELVNAEVKIPAPDGCASIFVDVDALQTGVYAGHELYLSSCLGPQSLRVDRSDGAATLTAPPTPEACAAQIAQTTTTTQLVLPVYAGLTICLLTSKEDATAQGLPQRLAIVQIRAVGPDHSVTATVSTYRQPV